ncbi:hypothetical protein BU24DRAFT_135558 [Aaosphaeria arxii CBS 175.79]|uniref:HMG box domain-containing protein n=1 Tax=Aaosphaeria arxii CBS 175.79 TaxID=1450172 RepID=A0A6A5Y3T4_9PLEO|nr:uncharacterized protein BU24DRAFT_135558 [Aaosphaeria arxii CBS 175.79]KAF2020225.1 hypothetical protein BU24DRAFT_135558 [Aaosphaeria arxii CBS 175.79]
MSDCNSSPPSPVLAMPPPPSRSTPEASATIMLAATATSPTMNTPTLIMPILSEVLERLGLVEYSDALVENGFRNWETVLDITEDDLIVLNFKLGHRRALQREIASFRGTPTSLSLEPDSNPSEQTSLSSSALESLSRQSATPPVREKRRYRRHPRPDSNAPKKPKTAYVNFADQLRTDPVVSALSFVDIAREVGRQWQVLPAEKKRVWESHAARTMQEYEAQMDEYKKTDSWRKYQTYLADFRIQQAPSPVSKLTRPTAPRVDSFIRTESSRASSASSDGPGSAPSFQSTGTEAEVCYSALTLAFNELVSLRGEILDQGVRPYDIHHLPAEDLMRRAMYAFIRGTGSLLYMWTYSQADDILEQIYRPQRPVDPMALAECFTVAAMGAHYDIDCFPDRIRKTLYASGTLHFHESSARLDYMRTMRLLLSMSFYALLEKHMSARYLIAAGLQIARLKRPSSRSGIDGIGDNWRRVFRSLIFMDCWLSYTLGYTSEVTQEDIAVACTYEQHMLSMDETIHIQTSKINLVAAEISKTLASPELVTRANIDMLISKLEAWRAEVPPALQLAVLTSNTLSSLTLYQRRAILMVHIMYLGALILVYRQLLIATAETQLTDGAAWNIDVSVEDAKRYRYECAMAGQQIARILSLISFDGTLTRRCWIIIYWAFNASIVLLFSATTKLLDGQPDGVEIDLDYAKGCMDILESCRSFEPIASRYLDMVWPLYDSLRDIHQRMVGRAKTRIFMLLQTDPSMLSPPVPFSKAEMTPISEKLSALITDPFGRKQPVDDGDSTRRVLNADGSCSVFWWR